ncbi:MAG: glycosyltransferase family 2 protein [Gemmobacter sp.]|uniref:glycosyltransferase family 2 protein n=1 Tax=Gemmobacter sp. TaxID=1898957 RepID=UPI003919FE1B
MARAPRWGVATTVQASPAQVAAFAAHYLDLGAHRIWLHFDNPDDPAADLLAGRDGITVTRCDAAYWQELCGKRPDTHQERQIKNVTRILRKARLDWIGHFDVDEFLLAAVPVAEALADLPADRLILRVEPWEALHDPALPDDIFTARAFRRQLPDESAHLASRLYGRFGPLLDRGMLSHTVGKCFFRTGVKDMVGRIHGARIRGEPVFGGRFHPDLALLHFHAQDPLSWKGRLAYRLERGAYQYRPDMQRWLLGATPDQVDAFYTAIQTARPDLLRDLAAQGLLREADLGLRAKVAARFPDLG